MTSENGRQMEWNAYGKLSEVTENQKNTVLRYDAAGNKITEITGQNNAFTSVSYVRDATGISWAFTKRKNSAKCRFTEPRASAPNSSRPTNREN